MSQADNASNTSNPGNPGNPVSDAEWRRFLDRHGHGGVHDGHVTAVVPFGAVVEIDGVHGLLPRTEWATPPEVGATLAVRIQQLDPERRRFSLTVG